MQHIFLLRIQSEEERITFETLINTVPLLCLSGERDGVESITAGVSRLSRDADRTSTGSTQSTGNKR